MDANALLREARDWIAGDGDKWASEILAKLDAYLSQAPAGGAPAPTPRADAPTRNQVNAAMLLLSVHVATSESGRAALTCVSEALRQHEAAAPPAAQEPVAWRFREMLIDDCGSPDYWSGWRHVAHKPQGKPHARFEVQPLYAAPSVDEHLPEPDKSGG